MAKMDYLTPGITKIEFEDSLFVTTGLDGDENKKAKEFIESRGGLIKNTVTKTTDYLIYKDGDEETAKYNKALELIRNKGVEIRVFSFKTFCELVTMRDTPDVSEISIEGRRFVEVGLESRDYELLEEHLKKHGGILEDSVKENTNCLIYHKGDWENDAYVKVMSMRQNSNSNIYVLSFDRFSELVTMKKETPDISKIFIKGRRFADAELDECDREALAEHLEKHGGILEDSVTADTDYLIFNNSAWETEEYAAAMSMEQEDGSGITVLSFETFVRLSRNALETVEFGTYLPEKGCERIPIWWIVVKKEKNRALLLSADGIGHRPYNKQYKDVTWETCTLREWLNRDFYNDAFTEEEKKKICLTKVRNEYNSRSKTLGGNDTEDRVFLLSVREAKEWHTRIERYNGDWWWLRSPGHYQYEAACVYSNGSINGYGRSVSIGYYAVYPALWIDLESDIE